MQKLRLGFALFREKVTDAQPHPVDKAAVVIALNLDGTAKLCVYDTDGSQFVLDRADLVQETGDVPAHYEEAVTHKPVPAAKLKGPEDYGLPSKESGKPKQTKPKQTNPKPEKDRGKGASPDEDEDEAAPGVKLNPTGRPSTIPGKETLPSVMTPEKGAEHAGIK